MLVFSLMFQSTKSNKSSEISSTTMTHCRNGLSYRSKPSWSCTKGAWEPHIFRWTISSSNRKNGMSNIFMEHFEKLALESAQHKPSLWLRDVDDTFVLWPHGPERLQNFLRHLSSLEPSIQFTMETESGSAIVFCDLFNEISNFRQNLQLSSYPRFLLTRSLIPRLGVVPINRKSLWALCVSHMWRVFQRSSNI
jgi:hypothetical protein